MFAHFFERALSLARTQARRRLAARAPLLLFALLALLLLATAPPVHAGSVLHVKPTGSDTATCAIWGTACSLQHALDTAGAGDEIWAVKGTYMPSVRLDPGDPRSVAFQLKKGVAIYGGFVGTEATRAKRNWKTNVTILSGDVGAANDATDNAYHVVQANHLADATAILNGFTIQGGNANGAACPGDNCGGGMWNDGSPTLSNLTFRGNTAGEYGGGMYNDGSPTLTNVTFRGNSAGIKGGGMYNDNSSPTLSNVTFSNNQATGPTGYGGGMYNANSSPTLSNVTFSGNKATGTTAGYGGGMYNVGSSATLSNVTFSNNQATGPTGEGGGVYNDSSSPALTTVTFSGNSATGTVGIGYGGAMYNYGSSPTLTNVTLSGNTATQYGGGMYNGNTSTYVEEIRNTILWGNTAPHGAQIYAESGAPKSSISYSIVQ